MDDPDVVVEADLTPQPPVEIGRTGNGQEFATEEDGATHEDDRERADPVPFPERRGRNPVADAREARFAPPHHLFEVPAEVRIAEGLDQVDDQVGFAPVFAEQFDLFLEMVRAPHIVRLAEADELARRRLGAEYEVLSGVEDGAEVVVFGQTLLSDGRDVNVLK